MEPAGQLQSGSGLRRLQSPPATRSHAGNDKPPPESPAAHIRFQSRATSRPSHRSFLDTPAPVPPLDPSTLQSHTNPPMDPRCPRPRIHKQSLAAFVTPRALLLPWVTRVLRPWS